MHRQVGDQRGVRLHCLKLAAGLHATVVLSWPTLANLPNDSMRHAGRDRATVQRPVVAEAVRNGTVWHIAEMQAKVSAFSEALGTARSIPSSEIAVCLRLTG